MHRGRRLAKWAWRVIKSGRGSGAVLLPLCGRGHYWGRGLSTHMGCRQGAWLRGGVARRGRGLTSLSPPFTQRLELRYPPTLAALAQELGAMAARSRPPGLLLLDGMEHYIQGGPSAPARLAALLLEASRAPRPPARLLAALRLPPPGPRVLPVLRRYFPAECRLRPAPGIPLKVNVRLVLPGAAPRGWRLSFGHQGELHVSPGPGDGDGDEDEEGDGNGGDEA